VPPPIKEKDDKKDDPKGVSPGRLLAPTLADAVKEQLGDGAKVVCLSLKDRGSALPGGQRPDACYWNDRHGRFVTSTYFRDGPHAWVADFNKSGLVDRWHGKEWLRLRPDLDYARRSGPDDVKGEGNLNAQGRTFPHPFGDGPKKRRTNYYAALANSPCGNELLLALAKKAVEAEKLGQRGTPDFLSISFSSNDLVGHTWGPDSQEVLDTTLRSDLVVKELLDFLDAKVGKGRYTVALTADHGICPLPEVSRRKGLPARRIDQKPFLARVEERLNEAFPPCAGEAPDKGKWVEAKSLMLYLDRKRAARRGAEPEQVVAELARWLPTLPGIARALTRAEVLREPPADEVARMVRASFHPDRSGDVMLVLARYCMIHDKLTGTTHGSPYDYDTHVPLVVMGPGVRAGVRRERVSPEQTAVILARALGIRPPARARVNVPEGLFGR
jgi:predicted AlkP superfamily pyrophosphatase or phosphodiesterase